MYTEIKEIKHSFLFHKIIITLPAISFSIWCLTSTVYNALIYEHLSNILKNITLHVTT